MLRLRTLSRLVSSGAVLAAVLLVPATARAEAAWYEGFEGPETSWSPAGGDARVEFRSHGRFQGRARTGDGCEHLLVVGHGGTSAYVAHDIGRARVIDELTPSVQVKSDRPGIQLFVRVVLPRTPDPQTGRAVTTLLSGSSYSQVGRWQQLRIADLPWRLTRQTHVLRARIGPHVDPREAYVDHVLLNVYGGPGATNVWIDDLDVAGYVGMPVGEAAGSPHRRELDMAGTPRRTEIRPGGDVPGFEGADGRQADAATMAGSTLLQNDRAIFPRAIQHQGEPFEVIRSAGFNTVWLPRFPSLETVEEARRLGLWLVCPPPRPPDDALSEYSTAALAPFGSAYDRVLAWDLGSGLTAEQLPSTRRWAQLVRIADQQKGRPVVCRPASELRAYSRLADQSMILLLGRAVAGTSLELADYRTWLRERSRLARPGTPFWTTVQTQPAPELRDQLRAVMPGVPPPTCLAAEQIRLTAYTAATSGGRGLLFESDSPLDADDPDTRQRVTVLELLNREFELAQPWLAGGQFVDSVRAAPPEVTAAVLQTKRAWLVIPVRSGPGEQFVAGQPEGGRVSLVVPGVPEEYRPYVLKPGGLQPLRRVCESGGVRITFDQPAMTSLVLLTGDPLVLDSLTRATVQFSRRAAQLQRELAAAKLEAVRQTLARRSPAAGAADPSAAAVINAQKSLQWADGMLARRDDSSCCLHAERAMGLLRVLQRSQWEAAVERLASPVASPGTMCPHTLPWHDALLRRLGSASLGPNLVGEGDFEDVGRMLQAGWSYYPDPDSATQPTAELSPAAARSGQFGLRLAALPDDTAKALALVESPPIWMSSPNIPVEAGDVVAVHGWVQVPSPITGSVDGLLIIDSLGGEPLAERIGETTAWREFTLYRAAPRSGPMNITFVLSGFGEAWIDDVTVQVLRQADMRAAGLDAGPLSRRVPRVAEIR